MYAAASFTNATSRCSSTVRFASEFILAFTMPAAHGVDVAVAVGVRFAGEDVVQPLAASAAASASTPSVHRYGLIGFEEWRNELIHRICLGRGKRACSPRLLPPIRCSIRPCNEISRQFAMYLSGAVGRTLRKTLMRPSLWIRLVLLLAAAAMIAGCATLTTNAPANTSAPTTAAVPGAKAPLVMLTEEYAPLNYHEDGRPAGIAIDLLNETLHRLGNGQSIDEVRFLPWAVAYNRTLVEPDTVLFSTSRLPSRENLFKWAGPIYPERAVLFGLRERNITIASPSELPGYRIGVVRDDAAVQKTSATSACPNPRCG